jgi:hypothetical protein
MPTPGEHLTLQARIVVQSRSTARPVPGGPDGGLKHPFRGHSAEIVEDCGPVSVGGRCPYAVRLRLDP